MQIESRVRLLKAAAAITMGFGLIFAVAAIPALNMPTDFMLNLVVPPHDGALEASTTRLLAAICGGVLPGWGFMAWLIASEVLPANPLLARRLILPSIALWFVIDSSMSIAAGAPLNAVLNLSFLALFSLPVLRLDPESTATSAAS